jgi:hypothetical protein
VRKVKNDRHDALWIADFIRIANLPATSRGRFGDEQAERMQTAARDRSAFPEVMR